MVYAFRISNQSKTEQNFDSELTNLKRRRDIAFHLSHNVYVPRGVKENHHHLVEKKSSLLDFLKKLKVKFCILFCFCGFFFLKKIVEMHIRLDSTYS